MNNDWSVYNRVTYVVFCVYVNSSIGEKNAHHSRITVVGGAVKCTESALRR